MRAHLESYNVSSFKNYNIYLNVIISAISTILHIKVQEGEIHNVIAVDFQ